MKKVSALPLFIFIFFMIFSISVHAQILTNNTLLTPAGSTGYSGMRCINSTADNKIWCYLFEYSGGNGRLVRYNATGQNASNCSITYTSFGGSVLNETHAVNCFASGEQLLDITNIAAGNCTQLNINLTGSGNCKTPASWNFGDYDLNTKLVWFPKTGIATLPPSVSDQNTSTWALTYGALSFPNNSDNSTYWIVDKSTGTFNKYVNGIITQTLPNTTTLWGITPGTFRGDILKLPNGENRAYLAAGTRFYVLNFSSMENAEIVEAFVMAGPVNATYFEVDYSSGIVSVVQLMTNSSGTLNYYFNGAFLSSMPINNSNNWNAGISIYQLSLPVFEEGTYNWRVVYTDNQSNTYYPDICLAGCTGVYFTFVNGYNTDYIVSHPFDALALTIGNLFGVKSLETARIMATLFFTLLFSGALVVLLAMFARIHSDILGKIFMISVMIWLVFFTLAGWFPVWLFIILIVIAAYIASKTLGIGG